MEQALVVLFLDLRKTPRLSLAAFSETDVLREAESFTSGRCTFFVDFVQRESAKGIHVFRVDKGYALGVHFCELAFSRMWALSPMLGVVSPCSTHGACTVWALSYAIAM